MSSFQIKKSLLPSVCGMWEHGWGAGEREKMCEVVNVSVGGCRVENNSLLVT